MHLTEVRKSSGAPAPSTPSGELPRAGNEPSLDLNLIFVVDDDPISRKLARHCLDHAGYRVMEASDGQEAIELLEHHHPALLLLDCRMPSVSGFEVGEHLRRRRRGSEFPIIIFLTSLEEASDKVQGFECGAVDYLTKPIEPVELLARIQRHLQRATTNHILRTRLLRSEETNARQSGRLDDLRNGQELLLTSAAMFPELKLAVNFVPACEAGGDFYELARLGDDEYAFLVTDVSGHDLSVPFITGALKAMAVTFLRDGLSSVEALMMFNESLQRFLPRDLYVTGCYARFDRSSMLLEVVSAGHPPALLQSVERGPEWIDSVGDAMGMHDRVCFEPKRLTVHPGDRLFLYTDGLITGFRDQDGCCGRPIIGMKRLAALACEYRVLPVEECANAIVREVERDVNGQFEDDVVLMVVEF